MATEYRPTVTLTNRRQEESSEQNYLPLQFKKLFRNSSSLTNYHNHEYNIGRQAISKTTTISISNGQETSFKNIKTTKLSLNLSSSTNIISNNSFTFSLLINDNHNNNNNNSSSFTDTASTNSSNTNEINNNNNNNNYINSFRAISLLFTCYLLIYLYLLKSYLFKYFLIGIFSSISFNNKLNVLIK